MADLTAATERSRRTEAAFDTVLDRFHTGPDMFDLPRFWTDLPPEPGSARLISPGRCGGTAGQDPEPM